MINSFEVINYLGESEVFELARPEKLGLAIKNIDGLGPGKANINTTDIATSDGSVFDIARLGNRNIVITFLLLPYDNTVEEARLTTYKYFPIKKEITLIFHTDNRDVYIKGHVESNEPNIFDEHETAKISIICPDPNFYDVAVAKSSFSTLTPMFEFPVESETVYTIEETQHENSRTDSYHVNDYSFTNFSEYFSYSGGRFTLLKDIVNLTFTLETYSYRTASSSTSEGALYYNSGDGDVMKIWNKCETRFEGDSVTGTYTVQGAKAGDSFFTKTPSGAGYPEEILTIAVDVIGQQIVFGNIEQFAEGNIIYDGDSDVGILIHIHATGTVRNVAIYNLSTNEYFTISDEAIVAIVGSSISAGDKIEISTLIGKKSITLIREGTPYNILNAVDKNCDWFKLRKGDNVFSYTVEVGLTTDLHFEVESNILYEGI